MSGAMWSVIKSSAHRTPMVGCGLYPEVPDPYNDRITSIGAQNRVNFMIKVFVAVLAVLGAWTLMAKLRKLPPHQQRKQLLKYGGWVLLGALLFMVLTGRAHWIVAVLGAMVPLMRFLIGLGFQMLPLLRGRRQAQPHTPPPAAQGMTVAEALATLGLNDKAKPNEPLDRATVITAHRRLMQKLHPDRGGSDYLAAKINEAKDVLLKSLH